LIRHGIEAFFQRDDDAVSGRKVPRTPGVNGIFGGRSVKARPRRPSGMDAAQARLGHNSIKMYDKQGSVARRNDNQRCARHVGL
jgi:hypothetical protein